ncbi:MAG: SpoIIE family protein phosphatase [Candidatus Krumholzibacteriota bacterium]|nr:SpoIIE family protein phosphatase [Candidatus Krumholzibacteriota bacterium]
MSESEIQQVLKVLSRAIIRETAAFNYYYQGSENTSLPSGVRGLLSKLAEEERRHRHLLMNEFRSVELSWKGMRKEGEEQALSYQVPGGASFIPLQVAAPHEIAAVSLPARLVGGDNILTSIIRDRENREAGTFLMLYDAMGHGIETTEINALAARIMGEYLDMSGSVETQKEILSPQAVVRHLNQKIHETYEGQGVFLTLLCALFDTRNKSMTYTLAGHEPPFMIHNREKVISLLDTQLIVGIDAEYNYREKTVPFVGGDVLCIFSDGIIEANNREGDIFGRRRVARILEESLDRPAEAIVENIMRGLRRFCAGIPLADEVSIIVFNHKQE